MVLVNEVLGYRVCLECHDVLEGGDEEAWLAIHLGERGCQGRRHHRRRLHRPRHPARAAPWTARA